MAALMGDMGLFKRKADPISERSRQLTGKIAELEARIKQLNKQVEPEDPRKFRSTAYPPGAAAPRIPQHPEPVFEHVDQKPLKEIGEPPTTESHFNEQGARKFDLVAAIDRLKNYFRSPPAANPKLVNYLAAGNIQGLRPLRYEKRVARNRFVALTLVLLIVLFGLFCFLTRKH